MSRLSRYHVEERHYMPSLLYGHAIMETADSLQENVINDGTEEMFSGIDTGGCRAGSVALGEEGVLGSSRQVTGAEPGVHGFVTLHLPITATFHGFITSAVGNYRWSPLL